MNRAPKRAARRPGPARAPQAAQTIATPAASLAEAPAPDTTEPLRTRRRRASVGGHASKLSAPTRPGFTRRWVNDDGNRIADMDELAYDHVTDKGVQSSDAGSRISRLVGTKANGEPLRTFLMETPDELYAEGVAEREAINSQVDQAIVKGADFTGQVTPEDGTYGRGSIQVER